MSARLGPRPTTMLARGARRRCPRCGAGGLFRRWFTMVPDCPRCGLHFERESGYWVGAVAVNVALVGAATIVAMVVALALTVPDVPVAALIAVLAPIALLGPLLVFPWSRTIWVALDRAFLQRLDRDQPADEQVSRR